MISFKVFKYAILKTKIRTVLLKDFHKLLSYSSGKSQFWEKTFKLSIRMVGMKQKLLYKQVQFLALDITV